MSSATASRRLRSRRSLVARGAEGRVVFEKFTDRARRVVVLAQEEARLLNHSAIGTEHLLLGIVHEGQGVAAQTLQALDIRLAAVRNAIEREAPRGASPTNGTLA